MIMNKQQVYIETVYLNLINLFLFYFYLFINEIMGYTVYNRLFQY